jgi:hypothetical protein
MVVIRRRPPGEGMLQPKEPQLKIEVVTDPEELARARAQREKFDRNAAWFREHATEVYSEANRGKYVCIAGGGHLFFSDVPGKVYALAREAFPDDDGAFVVFVPREKAVRIYAVQR